MARRAKWLDILGTLLISVLLGGSQAMLIASSMGLSPSPVMIYLGSIAVAALLSAGTISRPLAWASGALGAVAALVWALSPLKPLAHLAELVGAIWEYGEGGQVMLDEHAQTIALALALMLTLVMHWMCRMSGGVYPALTLSVIVLMGGWLMDRTLPGAYVIPMFSALAAMFARAPDDKLPYLRALPVGVLAFVLAFMLIPAGNPTWAPLQEMADKVRQMFSNYFMFTDSRITYSLYPDGFQPLGEALGGPAEPNDHLVMSVQSRDTLLLRGAIKRTYTTYSWTNSAVNNRYLFVDPTKRSTRDQVFDAARLSGVESGAFKAVSGRVTMLSEGISTFFLPHRIQDLMAGASDYAIYYNSSGEVFITRGVMPGDSYEFSALAPSGSAGDMEALLKWGEGRQDAQFAKAAADYTALPQGIESGVYSLARRLTEGARSPYQKAMRLQEHLMTSYQYNLDVPYPPRNRDFVSYFLLDSKQGYCSYFASAMAVMARSVGLPTRYIEGYMVSPSAEGETLVTGRNAHAWVEIYFNGIGWVPFNSTPGDGGGGGGTPGEGGDEGGEEEAEQEEEQEGEEEEDQGEDEQEQPEEQQADPEGGEDQGSAEDDPGQDDLLDSQSPEDSPESGPEEGDEGADEPAPNRWLWLLWLLGALILCGALGVLVHWRLRASDPYHLAKMQKNPEDRLIVWYRALLLLLEQQGQTPGASESPAQFMQRLKEAGVVGDQMLYVGKQLSLNRYARLKPESMVFKQAAQCYARQCKALKPFERLFWYQRRILFGLGDMSRVP